VGFVYVVKGKLAGRWAYYVGSTVRPLDARLAEHAAGRGGKTTARMVRAGACYLVWWLPVPDGAVRGVEFYLKRHRRVVYHVVGKTTAPAAWANFLAWCDAHGVTVGRPGREDVPLADFGGAA
jgi:predicted GIY-YIG superfamily endonuclease